MTKELRQEMRDLEIQCEELRDVAIGIKNLIKELDIEVTENFRVALINSLIIINRRRGEIFEKLIKFVFENKDKLEGDCGEISMDYYFSQWNSVLAACCEIPVPIIVHRNHKEDK